MPWSPIPVTYDPGTHKVTARVIIPRPGGVPYPMQAEMTFTFDEFDWPGEAEADGMLQDFFDFLSSYPSGSVTMTRQITQYEDMEPTP